MKYKEPDGPDVSELPELPEGWAWIKVEDITQRMQYGTSEKASVDPVGIPVLRMGNIQNGILDYSNLKYLSEQLQGINELILQDGDVLFNRTNSAELVGKTAVYKANQPKATFASYIIRVQPVNSYKSGILSYYINSVFGRQYIASVVSQQVGQANVNGTKLSQMPVPLMAISEQDIIVSEVERCLSLNSKLEISIETSIKRSDRLRQTILQKAFSGNLL